MSGTKKKRQQEVEPLETAIPRIFEQVQATTSNHERNWVALRKVHLAAAAEVKEVQKGKGLQLVGESNFQNVFLDAMLRILSLKKGVTVADRVVQFIAGYVVYINKKLAEHRQEQPNADDDENDDTMESRFVQRLLRVLLQGFLAKDKSVRFRSCALVARMVSYMGELEEDLYLEIRSALMDRVYDKEVPVRVQAVTALSKLCGSEAEGEFDENEQTAMEVLLDIMSQDPAAQVRRVALGNIPVTPATLPAILDRTRDVDANVRQQVFQQILYLPIKSAIENKMNLEDPASVGLIHPKAMQISQRELIVRNGLGDREPGVRAAASRVLSVWVDIAGDSDPNDGPGSFLDNLLAFLNMFDLTSDNTAEEALLCLLALNAEPVDHLSFDEEYWRKDMTPEKAFLARVFTKYCVTTHKDVTTLDGKLPVVTAFAFLVQADYNDLRQRIEMEQANELDDDDTDAAATREEARMDREFILGEMLSIAMHLDYGDEIGRRRMFQLVKDMITQESLPEQLIPRCLDVLSKLTPNEKELIRIVVEVVHDLRDSQDEEEEEMEPPSNADETTTTITHRAVRFSKKAHEDMTPEEIARVDSLDLRCLTLCTNMLERVNSTFDDNSTLQGLFNELIVPSVSRKESIFREKALVCLALCCLIARRMAKNSFRLFLSQSEAKKLPEHIKLKVLQAVFDILMVHERDFLDKTQEIYSDVVRFLLKILNEEGQSPKVEALVCTGLAKLVLSKMVDDDDVVKSLVLTYVSPHSAENQELRQCLSYFLPVFCYSSSINQRQLRKLFIPIFENHFQVSQQDEDGEGMIPASQFASMLADWTNPEKVVKSSHQEVDDLVHMDLAHDALRAILADVLDHEYKKALCQILNKLHIPSKVDDDDKIRTIKLLVTWVRTRRPFKDTSSKNALNKFDTMLSKRFEDQLKDFSEGECRKLERLQNLFEFLDDIIPLDDDEEPPSKKANPRKRRSTSAPGSGSDEAAAPSVRNKKAPTKKTPKRRKLETSDEDSDGEDSAEATPRAPRNVPKRAAAAKRKSLVEPDPEDDDDDDDDDDDASDDEPAPSPTPKKNKLSRTIGKQSDDDSVEELTSEGDEPEASDDSDDE